MIVAIGGRTNPSRCQLWVYDEYVVNKQRNFGVSQVPL
jgi:hypothetical protein